MLQIRKKAMHRVTVLCCYKSTGSDKQKLIVIGISFQPLCFKNVKADSLPGQYHSNKKAWMTGFIYGNRLLQNWNAELKKKSRKILLFVDNVGPNITIRILKNIQVEFLSPNTISLIQSLDAGMKNTHPV